MDTYIKKDKKINISKEDLEKRVNKLNEWKAKYLSDGRNIYSADEVICNGGLRPNNGEDALIGTLLEYHVLSNEDWEKCLKYEKSTKEGISLERINDETLRIIRTKEPFKTKELCDKTHKDIDYWELDKPKVTHKSNNCHFYEPNAEITKINKIKKEKEKSVKEKLKSHDWKKESEAVQMLAQMMGILE